MSPFHVAGENEVIAATDHDFSGCNLTPSVKLIVEPPILEDDELQHPRHWYDGDVVVPHKDSTLQVSAPWRHAAELLAALQEKNQAGNVQV
jgi:hypothetical protein